MADVTTPLRDAASAGRNSVPVAAKAAKSPGMARTVRGTAESIRPIWQLFEEATKTLPQEEIERAPTDLSEHHDHYLYGSPKG